MPDGYLKKMKSIIRLSVIIIVVTGLAGCYQMRGSNGGGEIKREPARTASTEAIALPPGYRIEAVASGLTFPTAVTFDDKGNLYVIESGYSYGEIIEQPKLLRIEKDGKSTLVAKGSNNGPWTGVVFHQDNFYIAEGGVAEGGRILKVTPNGIITSLITDLPTFGDHHTNGPAIKDGYIYFGLGTATNSGVVGNDNAKFGWLGRHQSFHDIPCEDITLNGINFATDNVLTTDQQKDKANTGAYSPYNTPTSAGQVIKGKVPCSGAILRMPLSGGKPELFAWGFRNPFGLNFSPAGNLFITENGFDDRGSRPVWGAGDVLWEVKQGQWYGWPDFSGGKPINRDEEFKVPGKKPVQPVLAKYPNQPPQPAAILGVHSSSNGFDFSTNAAFGHQGQAFIAQFGDMAPEVGKVLSPVGFKVIRVDVQTGAVEDFAVNKGKKNGPASWLKSGGLERPVSVKFDPSGKSLYVVDFGIMKMAKNKTLPQVKTGMIWRITKD
jgi:glucose/arabinose dehydrogenase